MCGSIKAQGNLGTFNGVLLVGDVTKMEKSSIEVTTIGYAADGREFPEKHEVLLTGKGKKPFELGDKVQVKGCLTQVDTDGGKRTKVHADLNRVSKVDKSAGYVNLAKLIGEVRQPFTPLPADPVSGRRGFGNLLVSIGENTFRGVLFATLATAMARMIQTGAIVQLVGRLQNREYKDPASGDLQSMLEVIANGDQTRVLKSAEQNDYFADWDAAGNPDVEKFDDMAANAEIPI